MDNNLSKEEYQVRQYLYSLDLESVKQRLKQWGWSWDEINHGVKYYIDYLYLRWKYPEVEAPPSEDIAVVWQAHIIDTGSYEKLCDTVFGQKLEY